MALVPQQSLRVSETIELSYKHKKTWNHLQCATVWKLQSFSDTQILREIKLGECKISKFDILAYLEDLKLDFRGFLHFLKAEIYQINTI